MQTAEAQTFIQPSINLADLAAPFQISRPTIGAYVGLLERLRADLASGAWHNKYGGLPDKTELDLGYRLIVAVV